MLAVEVVSPDSKDRDRERSRSSTRRLVSGTSGGLRRERGVAGRLHLRAGLVGAELHSDREPLPEGPAKLALGTFAEAVVDRTR